MRHGVFVIRFIAWSFLIFFLVGCSGYTPGFDSGPPKKLSGDVTNERRAISFGLYGKTKKYTLGALKNADLAPKIYPGWKVVFYVDPSSVPAEILSELKSKPNVVVKESPSYANPFSRFLIADDPDVDRFIVRDADSRLNEREKAAVDEWTQTAFPVHNMRDHPNHVYAMMAGMWGAKKGFLKSAKIEDLINQWGAKSVYGDDQNFLERLVQDRVGWSDVLVHDSYRCKKFPNGFSFPTARSGTKFVGQVVDFDSDGSEQFLESADSEECKREP